MLMCYKWLKKTFYEEYLTQFIDIQKLVINI